MRIRARHVATLIVFLGFVGVALPGCETAVSDRAASIDQRLHQTGLRHHTFGPTGERLFTERYEPGLGLRGQYSYIHYAEIRDPLRLEIRRHGEGESLKPELKRNDWYPSSRVERGTLGDLGYSEHKFITEDDVFVDQLTLTNHGADGAKIDLRLSSGFAGDLSRFGSSFATVDLRSLANTDPFPGGPIFTSGPVDSFQVWHEGEHPVTQEGSEGRDTKQAAAGGEVLGMMIGSSKEHFAEYTFFLPTQCEGHVYFRVARGRSPGLEQSAEWALSVDGRAPQPVSFPTTTGWGDREEDFRWVHVALGELLDGGYTLRLTSTHDRANINLDGFLISSEPTTPPATNAAAELMNHRLEQIAYRPARRIHDGVEFQLIDPAVNADRGVILVREQRAAGPVPSEVEIPIPPHRADVIHFLGQVAGPARRLTEDAATAEYELRFADGFTMRLLLTAGDLVQPSWEGLSVLSCPLPSDRRLESVVFRGLSRDVATALAAITLETYPTEGANVHLTGSDTFHGVRAHGVVSAEGFVPADNGPGLARTLELGPSQSITLNITMGMAAGRAEAERRAGAWASRAFAWRRHVEHYAEWYEENCPSFACSDPYITRLYWYRWFIARHNLSRARVGQLPHPYFFEGTHQRHFPRLIAFSSPHIISETRWLRDPQYVFGQVRNHVLNPDPQDAFFISSRIDEAAGDYNNWITRSAWRAYWVHPNRPWLEEVIRGMADDVLGTLRRYDQDGDYLPTPRTHWSTGMEFQPSFFHFNNYDDTKPEAPLERGDFAPYLYGNAVAVSEAYAHLGLPDEAQRFAAIADRIRTACIDKLWDPSDRFLYATHETNHAVAKTKEVVGFYPLAFDLFPMEAPYTQSLAYLIDPAHFWTPYPPATVSRECPAFTTKIATWPAPGGRTHGCMWNGPSWPHATSVVLDALGAAVKDEQQRVVTPDHFWDMFERYTHLQFEGDHLDRPYLTEYYDSASGEGDPDGCPDYFHSTYNDLLIKHLVGLQPANSDTVALRPIPGPVSWFALRGLHYRGHDLDIVYNGGQGSGPRGLTVWVAGARVAHRATLGELTFMLPEQAAATEAERPAEPRRNIYGEVIEP